jgi:hypothetical protein
MDLVLRLPGGWEGEFWASASTQRFLGASDTVGLLLGACGHITGAKRLEDQGARALLLVTAAAQVGGN